MVESWAFLMTPADPISLAVILLWAMAMLAILWPLDPDE